MTARLTQAVTDGKLTQAQADLITSKMTELQASMEAERATLQSLTPEQMKTKMEAKKAELSAWATANNIPEEFLRFAGKGEKVFGGHKGMGGFKIKSALPSVTPTTTTNS